MSLAAGIEDRERKGSARTDPEEVRNEAEIVRRQREEL